jgi:hypothetical protein
MRLTTRKRRLYSLTALVLMTAIMGLTGRQRLLAPPTPSDFPDKPKQQVNPFRPIGSRPQLA